MNKLDKAKKELEKVEKAFMDLDASFKAREISTDKYAVEVAKLHARRFRLTQRIKNLQEKLDETD